MAVLVSNNAFGFLAASITATATVLTLQPGQGALFPAVATGSGNSFYATLYNSVNGIEIVQVILTSTDTFTIVRGQDGTHAQAYNAGDRCDLRPTAALFNSKLDVTAAGTLYLSASAAASTYVAKSGSTMTGPLLLKGGVNTGVWISDTSATEPAGGYRFVVGGGNFWLQYNTAGAGDFSTIAPIFTVAYNSPQVAFAARPAFNGATPWDSSNLPNPYTTSGGTIGGNVAVTGSINAGAGQSQGLVYFANGGQYMQYNGSIFFLSASTTVNGNLGVAASATINGNLVVGNQINAVTLIIGGNSNVGGTLNAGNLTIGGAQVWSTSNLTALSQLANNVGYITGLNVVNNFVGTNAGTGSYVSAISGSGNTLVVTNTYSPASSGGGTGAGGGT
ncbi:hypothetical protein [Paraburkholderia unamae]|uniref:Uncharacterized protein n=1 Tax=Paraburkholderia unamae TaxID=219649 RepID=A0ACC6RH42_9BURK